MNNGSQMVRGFNKTVQPTLPELDQNRIEARSFYDTS